jgi:hypothetical protein
MLHRPETWGHFAEFYDRDEFLTENIAYLASETLRAGNSTVLIAAAAHVSRIEQHLSFYGFDLDRFRTDGRYISFDAKATLAQLMVDGWPNADRFQELIGGIIRNAIEKSASRFVFAFGEMVALLCAGDRADAALHLEQLWNSLNASYRFSLCCGYPLSAFINKPGADLVFDICAQHSLAIPAKTSS